MSTQLSINGSTVNRATAKVVLNQVHLDMDGPDTLEFTERPAKSPGTYRLNQSVTLTVDGTIRFKGQVVSLHPSGIGRGPISIGYRCMGLSWLANQIFVTAPDGSGRMVFNLPETDQDYIPANSGLNVGQILTRLYNAHASQLTAAGITTWSPTELANLTVVPPDPVHLSGRLWNAASGLLSQWHNKYGAWITADGVIHHPNLLTLPVDTLTLDTDPIILDTVSEDFSECYTQVVLRGNDDVQGAYLSLVDGTLAANWTAAAQAAWTYADYITPTGGYELGSISSMTSTTLSVTATEPIPITYSATTHWSAINAEVIAYNAAATGAASISFTESRRITSITVPSGNTYTLTVDTAFNNSGYTKYSIRGLYAAASLTWRDFVIVPEWVSTRMVKRFSHSVPWAPTDGVTVQTLTGMANVCFTQAGYKVEMPMNFTVVPSDLSAACKTRATATVTISGGAVTGFSSLAGGSGYPASRTNLLCYIVGGGGTDATAHAVTNSSGVVTSIALDTGGSGYTTVPCVLIGVAPGRIIFDQPICSSYCSQTQLNIGGSGIPAPTDVKVLLPYSRGVISATAPSGGGYQGTAYGVNNVQRTLYRDYPQWLDYKDTASYATLAQEILDTVKNTVIEGNLTYFGKYSTALTLGQALNIAGNGYTTGYEAIAAPIRSVTLDYAPDGGPSPWVTHLSFSTRLKPFSGDRIYAHSSWGSAGQLANGHNIFGLSTAQMLGLSRMSAEDMQAMTTAPNSTQSDNPADYGLDFGSSDEPEKKGKPKPAKPKREKYTDDQRMDTAMEVMGALDEEDAEPDSQQSRRDRAQSHGSLREARGLGPRPQDPKPDPQNQIGSDMAEELLSPQRRRALERQRKTSYVPGEDDVAP